MIIKRIFHRLITELSLYLPLKIEKNIPEIIVSLTSYPARLASLNIVIRSLLRQKYKPAKICLYLGTDTKSEDIPKKLIKFQKKYKNSFEIKTGYEDLKPHKKYFFAMQEYPESIIITVDDDLIYDCNLIKDLYTSYQKYPDCISARRVNQITKSSSDKVNPYSKWNWEYKENKEPSFDLLATGCGGVLYPAKILPSDTFNADNIRNHCLNTDDIWLKFMELKNNVKVVFTNSKIVHPLTLRKTQKTGLLHTNTSGENRNDINIKKMQELTKIIMLT